MPDKIQTSDGSEQRELEPDDSFDPATCSKAEWAQAVEGEFDCLGGWQD